MRVAKINRVSNRISYSPNALKTNVIEKGLQNVSDYPDISNYNKPSINMMPKTISFLGYPVHIVDGGAHALNMQHFANAISGDMDIEMHDVEVNVHDNNTKQLKSLEQELKSLNTRPNLKGQYIAVPALASVPLLNIQDQYNRIMKADKKFTPENVKANKEELLKFLKEIYNYPSYYKEYIGYMDSNHQGIEYTYGVIQEINKLVEKGARVYVPSGHPQDETLKWMAGERGLKPELYHYIATGEDIDGQVKAMHDEIKNNNWYAFNLLTLSDANIVGVKGASGAQDYMFAAYDSCITDGARGVYNFTPVRKNGEIIGYSYTDTTTNEYPYDEFPANDKIANIARFVGKKPSDVLATSSEEEELREALRRGYGRYDCADKLYPIDNIYTDESIKGRKMDIQGKYVDKTGKLFFDTNDEGKIIFPKCDCEGSGKPSVLSMWGSCFAVFNAIARDIEKMNKNEEAWKNYEIGFPGYQVAITPLDNQRRNLKEQLNDAKKYGNLGEVERLANKILDLVSVQLINIPYIPNNYGNQMTPGCLVTLKDDYKIVYQDLIDSLCKQNKYDEAKHVINQFINTMAHYAEHDLEQYKNMDLPKMIAGSKRVKEINDARRKEYYAKKKDWDSASKFKRHFITEPVWPKFEDGELDYLAEHYIEDLKYIGGLYKQVGDICKRQGESYPARVCYAASEDLIQCNERGFKVLQRRIDKVEYIGDLYPEIKED